MSRASLAQVRPAQPVPRARREQRELQARLERPVQVQPARLVLLVLLANRETPAIQVTKDPQDPQEPLERPGLQADKGEVATQALRAPQALQGPLAQPSVERLVLKVRRAPWVLRA